MVEIPPSHKVVPHLPVISWYKNKYISKLSIVYDKLYLETSNQLIVTRVPTMIFTLLLVWNMNFIVHFIYGMSSQAHWRTHHINQAPHFQPIPAPTAAPGCLGCSRPCHVDGFRFIQGWSSLDRWIPVPGNPRPKIGAGEKPCENIYIYENMAIEPGIWCVFDWDLEHFGIWG